MNENQENIKEYFDIEKNENNENDENNEVLINSFDEKEIEDEKKIKEDENSQLISKKEEIEKDNLIGILQNIEEELKKGKNINDVYEQYLINNEITKRDIKENKKNCYIKFMIYFLSPLLSIIHLIGIFILITLLKSLLDLLKASFNCYFFFDDKKCQFSGNSPFDFYNYYFNKSIDEEIDFNLMMITGFIGDILLKSRGYRISLIIFWIINIGSFFLIMNINFEFGEFDLEEKNANKKLNTTDSTFEGNNILKFDYNFVKILFILFCYILLLIGVGGSSLLSQQILIDSYSKFQKYEEEIEAKELNIENNNNNSDNKEENKKGNKKNIEIEEELIEVKREENNEDKNDKNDKNEKEKNDYKNDIKEVKEVNVSGSLDTNQIIQVFKEKFKKGKKKTLKEKERSKFDYFFMICLTTTLGYYGKYLINLFLNYFLKKHFNNNNPEKIYFYCIIGVYCICFLLSIILYSWFKSIFTQNKKTTEKESIHIYQICGYVIYSQDTIKKEGGINCFKLCLKSTKNCCNKAGCSIFRIIKEDCECCCCCCCEYNENDYDKNKEFFCYCYQAKRKSNWCNKFITNETQIKIVPYMIEYFLLQLTTIAFEVHYKNKKDDNTKIFLIIFITCFIFFFYFTISFSKFMKYYKNTFYIRNINDEKAKEKRSKEIESKEIITKLSKEILDGTHMILIFNTIFSLIFTSYYFSDESEENYFNKHTNYIFIPILMNKFYYLTLNYYCLYLSEALKGFELISGSTLISIYIMVWNVIIEAIKRIDKLYILYIIQIIFVSIPSLIIGLYFLIEGICKACCNCNLLHFLCCLISFFFCFGGLWIEVQDNCSHKYICCDEFGRIGFLEIFCFCYVFWYIIGCRKCCCCNKNCPCYLEFCDLLNDSKDDNDDNNDNDESGNDK